MDSKRQFYALEVMCRERAAVARKEMEYWLNEAQDWEQQFANPRCFKIRSPPVKRKYWASSSQAVTNKI
jgi:hypothetical protein